MTRQRWLCILLALILCAGCFVLPIGAAEVDVTLERAITAQYAIADVLPGQMLEDQLRFPAGESMNDWMAFTLAQCGQKENDEIYLKELEHAVTQLYMSPQNGVNGRHRLALTIMALGGDPTAFGTAADGTAIDLVADSTWNYSGDFAQETINIPAYALIVMGAADFDIPDDARYTAGDIAMLILEQQNPDGGFGLMPGTSDPDITAMVLQGLSTQRDLPEVQICIDAALTYLSGAMDPEGTFTSYGSDSCESLCQVIIALCMLEIDPDTDGRFGTPTEVLLQYQCEDGSFRHALADTHGDYLTTQQAILTLEALRRLDNGEAGIYQFPGGSLGQNTGMSGWPVVLLAVVAAVVIVTTVILMRKRGNKHV